MQRDAYSLFLVGSKRRSRRRWSSSFSRYTLRLLLLAHITCHPPPDSKSLSKTSTELTILVYLRPRCWCLGNICYYYYRCFSCCCCCHYYYDYHCCYYCHCRHPTRDYLFPHFRNGSCICSLIAFHSLGIFFAVIYTWSTVYSNVTYIPNSSKLNFLPPETSILREGSMIKIKH